MPDSKLLFWLYLSAFAGLLLAALVFDLRRARPGLLRRWQTLVWSAWRTTVAGRRSAAVATMSRMLPNSGRPVLAGATVSPIVRSALALLLLPFRHLGTPWRPAPPLLAVQSAPVQPMQPAPKRPSRLTGDTEFLPAALEILETPPSPVATALMLGICSLFVAGLAWSIVGQLDIHAVAQGKIQPSGRSKVVQPLDVGKVAAIRVSNGKVVAEGDVLVELDPTETTADLDAVLRDLEGAMGEATRRKTAIRATRAGTFEPSTMMFATNVGPLVRRREEDMLSAELAQMKTTIESLKTQLVERQATKLRLEGSIDARRKLLGLSKERVGMREEIKTRGAGSRALIIEAELQYENFMTTDASERGQLLEVDAAIGSLGKRIEQAAAQYVAEQTQKWVEAERRADRLEQDIIKARSRSERTRLKSPIAGTVQQLDVTTLGQVVSGGQALMSVVPLDAPLEVEVMIANKDIGFVSPGQRVTVKVEAFPFTRYGTIEGEVVTVSTDAVEERNASAMMDASSAARPQNNGAPKSSTSQNLVFPATLKLEKSTIRVDGKDIPLSPGMAVTAEIRTGRRRAISYLLSPLGDILSTSGRER